MHINIKVMYRDRERQESLWCGISQMVYDEKCKFLSQILGDYYFFPFDIV